MNYFQRYFNLKLLPYLAHMMELMSSRLPLEGIYFIQVIQVFGGVKEHLMPPMMFFV